MERTDSFLRKGETMLTVIMATLAADIRVAVTLWLWTVGLVRAIVEEYANV